MGKSRSGDPIHVHEDVGFLKEALRASGVGIWSFIDGEIRWDEQTLRLFETGKAPTTLEGYLSLVHTEDRELVSGRVKDFLNTGIYEDLEHRIANGDGTRWVLCRGMAIRGEKEEVRGLVGLTMDITARKQAETKLASLSITDDLTGLANRRRVVDVLARESMRCARLGKPLSVIICDIDYFKRYNDTFGHPRGDQCLKQVAGALRPHCKRSCDLIARYGGEEFLAVLPDTPLEDAGAIAEQMRSAVADLGIEHAPGAAPRLTISAGVASRVPAPSGGDENLLIKAADEALYRAKRGGRNRVELQD